MSSQIVSENARSLNIGYVVVAERKPDEYVGGYLCANERGVPLEFWHTLDSPVKTSRMQKLLYGNTLKPELFGKNIVGALVQETGKSRPKPSVLLTDEEAVFLGADIQDFPILQIRAPSSESEVGDKTTVERISTATGEMVMRWRSKDKIQVKEILPKLINIDIVEPFQRVRRLLDEMGGKRTEKVEN